MPATYAQRRRAALPPQPQQPLDPCAKAALTEAFSSDVELDDTYIYFTDDAGSVYRMAKTSNNREILGSVPGFILVLAIDATNIYALTGDNGGNDGAVWAVPKAGGTPQQLAGDIASPFEIAADGNNVYWVSAGTASSIGFRADGKVEKVSKSGTGRTTLASNLNLPTSVASDGTTVYFGETGLSPDSSSRGLRSVPANGGSVKKLTSNTGVVGLTLSGNDIFYANVDFFTGGELLRMPKSGGNSTSVLKGVAVITHMAVAGNRLYFYESTSVGAVQSVPITGGSKQIAVNGPFLAEEFAIDDCAIYTIDAFGSLNRTPR
jgi:hypothetical protein